MDNGNAILDDDRSFVGMFFSTTRDIFSTGYCCAESGVYSCFCAEMIADLISLLVIKSKSAISRDFAASTRVVLFMFLSSDSVKCAGCVILSMGADLAGFFGMIFVECLVLFVVFGTTVGFLKACTEAFLSSLSAFLCDFARSSGGALRF